MKGLCDIFLISYKKHDKQCHKHFKHKLVRNLYN